MYSSRIYPNPPQGPKGKRFLKESMKKREWNFQKSGGVGVFFGTTQQKKSDINPLQQVAANKY